MGRIVKLLVVLALLALVPLRGLAAVTVGICATTQSDSTVQVQGDHGHDSHSHGQTPDSGPNADCNACAEHCTSASVVVAAPLAPLAVSPGSSRLSLPERFAAGHVPEHLDPPPLAL